MLAFKRWFGKAWAWLKRSWKWLLLPVGVLIWVAARLTSKKEVTVISPGLVEHEEVRERLELEATQKKAAADVKAAEQLSGIEATRTQTVAKETQKQIDAIKEAQDDSQKVNDLLKSVGKDMRK